MTIDILSHDARSQEAAQALSLGRHIVRSGLLFSSADTPPDLLLLPIPQTRDGIRLNGTPYTLADCQAALMQAKKPPLLIGYGAPDATLAAFPYYDLEKDENFVLENAALTAEGGMLLLGNALAEHGISLKSTAAVILGYGRIARAMAHLLRASGAEVIVGARRAEARLAARDAGYLTFDCADTRFFSERGRLLFAESPHLFINTVPAPDVIPPFAHMPHPLLALELSGKADVLTACEKLPYPTLDGKSIPTRFFPKTAGALLARAIEKIIQ